LGNDLISRTVILRTPNTASSTDALHQHRSAIPIPRDDASSPRARRVQRDHRFLFAQIMPGKGQ
jgi:hypothetical protein